VKRRDFNKAMVYTTGGLMVPAHVANPASVFVVTAAPALAASVYRLDAADFPSAEVVAVGETALDAAYGNGTSGDQGAWDAGNDGYKLTQPSESAANGAGELRWVGALTGAEDTVTMAYRYRCDEEYVTGASYIGGGGSGSHSPKLSISYEDATCEADEFTLVNVNFRRHVSGYANCGAIPFEKGYAGSEIGLQPRDSNKGARKSRCGYLGGQGAGGWTWANHGEHTFLGDGTCFVLWPDTWFTIVELFDLTDNKPTHVEVWGRYDTGFDTGGVSVLDDDWYEILTLNYNDSFQIGSFTFPRQLKSLYIHQYRTSRDDTVVCDPCEIWVNDVLIDSTTSHANVKSIYGIPY
jgi:hypothetical protein